jgi:putative transposase
MPRNGLCRSPGGRGPARPISARKYGISEATCYNWKAQYAGLTASAVKRLKALEDENRRLEQIAAEQTSDSKSLKDLPAGDS